MMPLLTAGYSCQDIADRTSDFIDGDLSTLEWARFRIHLLSCPPCAEYVRQFGITIDRLHALQSEEGQQIRATVLALFDEWSASQDESPDEE